MKPNAFTQAAQNWTPVPTRGFILPVSSSHWTQTALDCLELNSDCKNCPIHKLYELDKSKASTHHKHCHQAKTVQLLLDAEIKAARREVKARMNKV